MNLFSVFNPSSWFNLNLNWVMTSLILSFLPIKFWISNNKITFIYSYFHDVLHSTFSKNVKPSFPLGSMSIYVSLFLMIALTNFLGLMPYVFTPSSHLSMNLSITMPLWLGFMILSWIKTPNLMLAHLVPSGAPSFLLPFMVVIELISSLIRPITLSVRLTANMMAGHLLMTLLSSASSTTTFSLIIPILVILCTLESAVALIQAYVFSILSILYIEEVNSTNMNF